MFERMDKKLLIIIAVMVLFGVVMVYSASSIQYAKKKNDPMYKLRPDIFNVAVASLGLYIAAKIDYRKYRKFAWPFLIFAAVLLFAVWIPWIGAGEINGAQRWLDLRVAKFQPAEIVKLALIVFLAAYLSHKGPLLKEFKRGFLVPAFVVGVLVLDIALQPSIGTAFAFAAVSAVMFYVAGVRFRYLLYVGLGAVFAFASMIAISEHGTQRIMTWLVGGDPLGDAFQVNQSLIAIGSGGLFGTGIGQGVQKLFYIPEIETDFIFAVVGEELGFLGTTSVLVLFALFAWRGLKIAMRARDDFGRNLAIGIVTMITIHAAINIGMVLGVLPNTGVPLPFLSYGGSNLLFTMVSCGVLLNISSHVRTPLDEHLAVLDERLMEGVYASAYSRRRNRRPFDSGVKYRPGAIEPSSGRRNIFYRNRTRS